jgi:hypothetical protein
MSGGVSAVIRDLSPHSNKLNGGKKMTVVENPGSLQIVFALPDEKTRRESIMNIRPTAADQDLYDIGLAIANLIDDTLTDIRLATSKTYSA